MISLNILFFLAGILLLWASSELVTRNIGPIARRFGVNELVVTILGVSVFSSLPELSISAFSALQGNADVSIGNVIGSNFVTLTFVTALCALIMPMSIKQEIRDRESSWMILSTVVILVLGMDGLLSRTDGFILVGLYFPYIFSVIREAGRSPRESGEPRAEGGRRPVAVHFALEAAGIAGIIFGARLALANGEILGLAAGIPPLALGAILFAFGTSLPELAIAVSATLKNRAEISLGEIYASNIFTALAVLGICCILAPLPITDGLILKFDIPMLILAGVIIQIFITTGAKLIRFEAVLIMIMYGYFVYRHFAI